MLPAPQSRVNPLTEPSKGLFCSADQSVIVCLLGLQPQGIIEHNASPLNATAHFPQEPAQFKLGRMLRRGLMHWGPSGISAACDSI